MLSSPLSKGIQSVKSPAPTILKNVLLGTGKNCHFYGIAGKSYLILVLHFYFDAHVLCLGEGSKISPEVYLEKR